MVRSIVPKVFALIISPLFTAVCKKCHFVFLQVDKNSLRQDRLYDDVVTGDRQNCTL